MYRLVPTKYSLIQLLLAPIGFPVGVVLLALAAWISASQPLGDEDTNMLVGIPCYVLALAGLVTSFVGFCFLYDAYRNGSEIIFDDQLTIHYPWPRGTQVYSWNDVKHIQEKSERVVTSNDVAWVPLPLDALVPGAGLLSVTVRKLQVEYVGTLYVVHDDGRIIAQIESTPELKYQFKRWFENKTLSEVMQVFKGRITWQGHNPRVVTIHNFPFEPGMFMLVHEWLSNRPGLVELDLSGSNVRDADLQDFASEQYPDLQKVHAAKTRVTPKYLAQLNAYLGQKSNAGVLNFG